MRIALGLEYDGSHFCGWQSQPGGCGVQDALEKALSEIAGHEIGIVAAGRTDTGVHASGQVVHFDTTAVRPGSAWVRGVNAMLPASVAVLWSAEVPDRFHARFSARSRHYRYLLLNHQVRPALLSGKVGWHHVPLNIVKMRQAAALLVGEHDFSAFRAAECQAKTPVKQLYRAEIRKQDEFVIFDFHASAFLHHMVRNIVGCLVYVGKGRHEPAWLSEVLASRDRRLAAPTFAPDGLYLTAVDYDMQWQLPLSSFGFRVPGFGLEFQP